MKITLLGPVYPYRGSIAPFMTTLAQELITARHSVQVLSFARQYPAWLYPGQSDQDPSVYHTEVPAVFVLDPFKPWTWQKTVQQTRNFAPDLVLIQWWTTFWTPAFWYISAQLRRHHIACLFCVHNVFPHEGGLFDRWMVRRVLSQGSGFIPLSPQESTRLTRLLPQAQVYPARLPVPKVPHPVVERHSARAALGVADGQPLFLFFGLIRSYKGLRILLDALGMLKAQGCQPDLLVVGEFWDALEPYQQQIKALGLVGQVRIENYYAPEEDVARYFSAADVFVAPYIHGTQSGAIKMAMRYHLPILASDQIAGDLPVDQYPIFLHVAGDAADLARSIRDFLRAHPTGRMDVPNLPDGWADLVTTIERAGEALCPSASA